MSAAARPNILWILGNQHRAHATGDAGDPNVHTPNLDLWVSVNTDFKGSAIWRQLMLPATSSFDEMAWRSRPRLPPLANQPRDCNLRDQACRCRAFRAIHLGAKALIETENLPGKQRRFGTCIVTRAKTTTEGSASRARKNGAP
jgi:hypothetical protein